jgi:Fe-S oxidoreductase
MWMEERIGRRINVTRIEQALPQQPKVIASACPYCATMMIDGLKQLNRDKEVAVRDIAELVADSLAHDDGLPGERL